MKSNLVRVPYHNAIARQAVGESLNLRESTDTTKAASLVIVPGILLLRLLLLGYPIKP